MNVASEFEQTIKLLILGDAQVGKTNIISQFVSEKFVEAYNPTSTLDFQTKIYKTTSGKVIKLQIFDSIGKDQCKQVTKNFLVKVQGIILVYDITNQESFDNIDTWIKTIRNINESIPIILIANKCDKKDDRIVSFNEGDEIAAKNNMTFVECSAMTGINIKDCFDKMAEMIFNNFKNKPHTLNDDELMFENMGNRESITYKDKNDNKCCIFC